MNGKICMITGANSGIGKATALGLAKLGATVIIVCRNKSRGETALAETKEKSGNENLDLMMVDLASQESVRQLVKDFEERYRHLHVLINNAGTYFTKRQVTVDGIEATFAVNYLTRFLLTNLLLRTLKNSSPARIINVAGAYHSKGAIDFDDLQKKKDYDGAGANNQSKLADILCTYELARRLKGTGVTVNCLHPGAVATNLVEKDPNYPSLLKFLYKLFKPFLKSPEKGAETSIYLASSPEVEGVTGKYFVDKKESKSSKESYDESVSKRLWEVSAKLTKIYESGIERDADS